MAEDAPFTPKPSRPPRNQTSKRRDFATIIRDLEAYSSATIDILEAQAPLTEFGKGTIAFAKSVMGRIKAK